MKRYLQQIIVPEVGPSGQERIIAAKVLVVGAGGLGTPVAAYLASAGVGTVDIMDGDMVAETNLARQFLYSESDIGCSKAAILAAKLNQQNPAIPTRPIPMMLEEWNAKDIIGQYDIVCDCSDSVDSRLLTDRICDEQQKPLIYAAVRDWEAYVTVLHGKKRIALNAVFSLDLLKENAAMNCSSAGIINTTCGITGSIQANECLKIILGIDSNLDGGILCINGLGPSFRVLALQ
jgi:molybdopterin/thiamine biosynthesis adenylyltransferase